MVSDNHLGLDRLTRLIKGEVTRSEAAKLLLHLQRCQDCLSVLDREFPSQSEALWKRLYGDLSKTHVSGDFSLSALVRSREAEVRAAKVAFAKLKAVSPEKHRLIVVNSPAFSSLAGVQFLLDEARDQWRRSPQMAYHWSELGLRAIEEIPADQYSVALVADYTARAWAYVANATRLGSSLQAAEEQFKKAAFWLTLGTQEPLEAALLCTLEGLLARDKRCFEVALQKLERALTLYRSVGDRHYAAWLEVELSNTNFYLEEYEAVVEDLESFVRHHTATAVGTSVLVAALQCLGLALVECGRVTDAAERLREARRLAGQEADLLVEARFDWLESRILAASGRFAEAEGLFRQVKATFLFKEIPYDAALVSLDLAELLLQQGATAEAKDLAQDIIAIFHERGIHREARKAGMLLGRALLEEEATVKLVKAVARYLKLARRDPSYRFTPDD